jgi:thymidylate synthase
MLRQTLRALKSKRSSLIRITNVEPLHDEYQYLRLVNDIVEHGELVSGRNGDAKTIIGASMHFNLANGTLPLLTTKKVAWKTCLRELLWFIRGDTDNNVLAEQNVGIWNDNASREFLDSRGLYNNRVGDLGPVYGHQWRHFNADYTTCETDYTGLGVDQLGSIVETLKDPSKRSSRRMVVSAWNPCQIDNMALPPCHVLMQFNVLGNKLHCSLYQRSADVGLGLPFNIASYSMLTHLLAHHVGLEPGEFVHHLGNCHIYDDHIKHLVKQVEREPYPFPTLRICDRKDALELYEVNDFVIKGYKSHPSIKMAMRQ